MIFSCVDGHNVAVETERVGDRRKMQVRVDKGTHLHTVECLHDALCSGASLLPAASCRPGGTVIIGKRRTRSIPSMSLGILLLSIELRVSLETLYNGCA